MNCSRISATPQSPGESGEGAGSRSEGVQSALRRVNPKSGTRSAWERVAVAPSFSVGVDQSLAAGRHLSGYNSHPGFAPDQAQDVASSLAAQQDHTIAITQADLSCPPRQPKNDSFAPKGHRQESRNQPPSEQSGFSAWWLWSRRPQLCTSLICIHFRRTI